MKQGSNELSLFIFPPCSPAQVLIEVAQAVQHLHSLKLIHCDIKVSPIAEHERPCANIKAGPSGLCPAGPG